MSFLTLTSFQRIWLLGLLALWAVLLFGGFFFGAPDAENTRRMPQWMRLYSSVVLVLAGWSWFFFARGAGREFALLVAIGITFGLLGDVAMAGLLPFGQRVLNGIASFGMGHLFYIAAFLRFASQQGWTLSGSRVAAWVVWLFVGLIGWYFFVFRGQQPTLLHWAALPYALLLASTAGVATGLALRASDFLLLAVGAALFLLSDLILAGQIFSGLRFTLIGDVIWLTYGPGQMLIVYAVGVALRLLNRS